MKHVNDIHVRKVTRPTVVNVDGLNLDTHNSRVHQSLTSSFQLKVTAHDSNLTSRQRIYQVNFFIVPVL